MNLNDVTEKEWDTQLFNSRKGLVTMLGWQLTYHTLRSKGSRSGFPDRVLVRERVVFVELKREGGKPSDEQVRWLTGLAVAGAEVYLWRPSDIDEIARVVGTRGVTVGHPVRCGCLRVAARISSNLLPRISTRPNPKEHKMTAPASAPTPQTGANAQSVKVTVTKDTVNGIEYVVLRESANGTWKEEARKTARTPDAAIEDVIGTNDPGENGWIAIAARYWSPQQYESVVNRSLVKKAAK